MLRLLRAEGDANASLLLLGEWWEAVFWSLLARTEGDTAPSRLL
jgi:hypothetical protein